MKGHISNRSMAAYLAEAMDASTRERIGWHIAGCDRCRALHDNMASAISPRYRSLQPGSAVRARVMRTREELERGDGKPAPAGLLHALNPRLLGAAALGLAAAIVVALAIFLSPPAETGPALVAVSVDPGVTVDGRPALRGARVYESGALVLPDNTMARFDCGHGFSMTLIGPCVMTIDRLSSRGPSGGAVMECSLEQGILVSASDGSGELSYSYNTPGARVEPAGTEFLLQASGERTLVVMNSGRVRVMPVRSGDTTVVPAGSRCLLDEKVGISPASVDDLKMVKDHEGLRAGSFARSLLPVLPLKGGGRGERPLKDKKKRGHFQSRRPATDKPERRGSEQSGNVQGMDQPGGAAIKEDGKHPRDEGRIDNNREADRELRRVRGERTRRKRAAR
jgi:hypothetical protein